MNTLIGKFDVSVLDTYDGYVDDGLDNCGDYIDDEYQLVVERDSAGMVILTLCDKAAVSISCFVMTERNAKQFALECEALVIDDELRRRCVSRSSHFFFGEYNELAPDDEDERADMPSVIMKYETKEMDVDIRISYFTGFGEQRTSQKMVLLLTPEAVETLSKRLLA